MAMFCGSCGEKVLKEGKCSKCKGDGAFRTRLYRALSAMKEGGDQSIAVSFTNLSDKEKAKFKQEHHETLGAHLKMAIRNRVTLSRKTQTTQAARAKGHMKDEIDLREKYGKKPEQLANILKNAYSITCPIRRVQLWADPDPGRQYRSGGSRLSPDTCSSLP